MSALGAKRPTACTFGPVGFCSPFGTKGIRWLTFLPYVMIGSGAGAMLFYDEPVTPSPKLCRVS